MNARGYIAYVGVALSTLFASMLPPSAFAAPNCLEPTINANRYQWQMDPQTLVQFTFEPSLADVQSVLIEISSRGLVTGEKEYHSQRALRGQNKSVELHRFAVTQEQGPVGEMKVQAGAIVDASGAVSFGAGRAANFVAGDPGGSWISIGGSVSCVDFNPNGPFLFSAQNTGAITLVDASIVGITDLWRQLTATRNQCQANLATRDGELAACRAEEARLTTELASCTAQLSASRGQAEACQNQNGQLEGEIVRLTAEVTRLRSELRQSHDVVDTVRGQTVYNLKRAARFLGGVARRELAADSQSVERKKAMKMMRRIMFANQSMIDNATRVGSQIEDSKNLLVPSKRQLKQGTAQ